jgi:mycothiol maleylpyruvate isomerase-like protein
VNGPIRWPELVGEAAAGCTEALVKGADADWGQPAGDDERSCRELLDHLALGVLGYAGLLIARPTDRYITLFGSLDPAAPIATCLEGIRIAGALLATTVRDAPADVRAWHPWGHADAAGFAAMGVVELLVHTYDIARTLGIGWTPPDHLTAPALARLFPNAPTGHAPADTLVWCTGRGELPGRERVPAGEWAWDGRVR